MNLDDACMYLNISPDDEDLNLDEIKRNYYDKLAIYNPEKFSRGSPEYIKAQEMRNNLNEAYNFLLNAYSQIYGENQAQNNNNLFLKLALVSSLVIILCFAVSAFLLYKYKFSENITPAPVTQNSSNSEDYSRILRELEELRAKTQTQQQPPQKIVNTPANYADLVERVMPSIVLIETDNSRGSGFFVSSKGEILTNYHVIKNAHNIRVSTRDNKKFTAQIKDYDSKNDMALIVINSGSTPFLKISQVLPRQGESVIAIGNPKGLEGTVSNGIISAFRENNKWVQFTAAISPGSSGGALINLRGEVVGMPTQYMTEGQNLNFAVAPTLLNNFFKTAQNNNSVRRTQTQKISREGEKISLPNSRGFNSIKWNSTFSSIESAINSELNPMNDSEILFTSGKIYKAFKANFDVIVGYAFDNYKLKGVMLVPHVSEFNAESTINKIIRELSDIYGSPLSQGYDNDDEFNTIWKDSNMAVMLLYQESSSTLIVMFTPFL